VRAATVRAIEPILTLPLRASDVPVEGPSNLPVAQIERLWLGSLDFLEARDGRPSLEG
jgi:hypothetical protein